MYFCKELGKLALLYQKVGELELQLVIAGLIVILVVLSG